MATVTRIPLKDLQTHPDARYRRHDDARELEMVIEEYADQMTRSPEERGFEFPPIIVYKVSDKLYVGDGWLRAEAAKRNGSTEIEAEVREGSLHDLIMFGRGVNEPKMRPRSYLDKRQAVYDVLHDEAIPKADRENHSFVERATKTTRWLVIDVKRYGVKKKETRDNRYFTPKGIIDSLHEFAAAVGCFEEDGKWFGLLDPASEPKANDKYIRAKRIIEKDDFKDSEGKSIGGIAPDCRWVGPWYDGMEEPASVVWLNPPFSLVDAKGGKEEQITGIEPFIAKAVSEWREGNVEHVIALLPIRVASQWWKYLIGDQRFQLEHPEPNYGSPQQPHSELPVWSIIFIDARELEFGLPVHDDGKQHATQIGVPGTKTPLECMICYLGNDERLFVECFGRWGDWIPAGTITAVTPDTKAARLPLTYDGKPKAERKAKPKGTAKTKNKAARP